MIRATAIAAAGTYPAEAIADTIELDYEDRSRRRLAMTGARGTEFLVDLAETPSLRHGDAFVLDGGRLVAVAAKAERLAELVTDDAFLLARIAWHLGNRHVPAQILSDRIRIGRDHVLEELMVKLGAKVARIEAPFDPEGGAYAEETAHAHGHHHHGHDHAHHHDHEHGDNCGCGHDHSHDHHHDHGHHHHGHAHKR